MNYLDQLEKLNLPEDKFAIFGSGPLAIRKLRKNSDIDIIVTPELWKKISEKYLLNNDKSIKVGNIEIYKNWEPWLNNLEELIATADQIEGYRFVKLEYVLEWKRKMGRSKDLKDIKIIEAYLENQVKEISKNKLQKPNKLQRTNSKLQKYIFNYFM